MAVTFHTVHSYFKPLSHHFLSYRVQIIVRRDKVASIRATENIKIQRILVKNTTLTLSISILNLNDKSSNVCLNCLEYQLP